MTEYEAEGWVVRSARVVPIGPWCVSWWEQFAAGFRLELEVGSKHAPSAEPAWVPPA